MNISISVRFNMSGRQGGKLKPLKSAKSEKGPEDEFDQAHKQKMLEQKKAMEAAAKKLAKK